MTKIILRYFPVVGRAQPLRHALADSSSAFEDLRVDDAEWKARRGELAFGGPYRGLPTLTWGDVTIGETLPIASFIAKKLGQYEGLDDAEIARREAVCSNVYIEISLRLAELIYSSLLYPGTDPGKAFGFFLPRMLEKLALVDAQYSNEFLGGKAQPTVADFFAAEAVELMRDVLGESRDAALRSRLPRLCDLAERLAARPTLAEARANRPTSFTARPDEAAVIALLREVELPIAG